MRNTLKSLIMIISSFCLLMVPHQLAAQSQVVDFVPSPLSSAVTPGANFSVVITVETNGQATAAAEIHLDFDPNFVEVISLSAGTALSVPLISDYDNTAGTIDYAAGTFGVAVSSDFTLVTINFQAKSQIGTTSPIYQTVFPRQTAASFNGQPVLNQSIPFDITVLNPCNLTSSGLQVGSCNDNNTPSDPSDDTFSFSIDPGGTDLGSGYTVSGDVSGAGTYGNVNTFSGLVAGGGDLSVTVTDNDDPNCSITFTVTDPGTCSGACNLASAGLANVSCNDNGTPSNPSDDYITFSLNPTGNNLGASYSVAGDLNLNSISYGQSNFFSQAGTAGQGDLSLTLTDANDPSCQLVVIVTDPGTCSNDCEITASGISNISCNDNSTPTDPSDDFITFDLDPSGFNLGNGYSVSGATGMGTYGITSSFTTAPGTAGNGDINISIIDNNSGGCTLAEVVSDPGTCSDLCNLASAALSNIQCNDNNTPADPSDDYITFELSPSGNALGASYSLSSGISPTSAPYGGTTLFSTTPGTAGNGDVNITLTDNIDGNCTISLSVTDPGTCSNNCEITASGISNINCNDNGTPTDPSDDFITFDLDPTGFNLGNGYSVSGTTGTGTYGGSSSFSTAPGTAGNGDINITIVDDNNGGCTLGEVITDPGTCSNQCNLATAALSNIQCNDNNTPSDPSDDYITFELSPSGNALGANYSLSSGISPASAPYGITTQFSTAPGTAGNGDVNVTLIDNIDGNCSISLTVTDPGTCSNTCLISDLGLSNIQCNDNGTDGDPSDDYFTFELNPTGNALGATYNLSSGISPSSGTYGSASTFSTAPGTAGSGDINITVTDVNGNGCTATTTVTDPGSCSNANALSFVIGSGDGITCGSLFIPVTVLNYTDILGGQGSINWDPAVASLVGTSNYGVPDLTAGGLSMSSGQLNFSYNDGSIAQLGHTLADGDTLILLEFDISAGVLGGSSPVEFSNTVPALFFDVSLSIINPLATPGTINVPNATNIIGKAVTEVGTVINGVTFKMSGDDNPPEQLGSPGYDFNFTRCGANEIGAFKNNDLDVDQGVNTLDIIFIQRQILGITPLNSPYKNIAADVNYNGLVEGLDITFIRQLILQIRQAFPEPGGSNLPGDGARLWAFVPSDAVYPIPFSPIAYDTGRVYNPINPLVDQDFIGMKLGDVDNSWDIIGNKTGAVDDITFQMPDLSASVGEEIVIPVSVKDFSNVTGYQFTMSWDPSVLAFHAVVNKNLQTVFGEQEVSNGHLTASWNDVAAQAISLDDGTEVFELHFKVIGQETGSSSFSINSFLTQSEAYNDNLQLLDILSSPATITLGGTTSLDPADNQGFGLYQNMPNPFDRFTNIAFELPTNNEVKIEIYNNLGQVIKTFVGVYPQGKHQIRWDGTNESGMQVSAGVYYARMTSADFNGTIQMQRNAQ